MKVIYIEIEQAGQIVADHLKMFDDFEEGAMIQINTKVLHREDEWVLALEVSEKKV